MGRYSLHQCLLVFILKLCVSSAPHPFLQPPVRVQCFSNQHILRRPLRISSAAVDSETSVLVRVQHDRASDIFNRITCGPLYPKLLPCPFDESPRNGSIVWQFCPEGERDCRDRPVRSFFTFLLIAAMQEGDQGTYYCRATFPGRILHERWEVRRVRSGWDFSWSNNSFMGFHVQLSHSGALQNFEEKFIEI